MSENLNNNVPANVEEEIESPKSGKKQKQPRQSNVSKNESLLEKLANELNKENKDGGKLAYFLDEQDDPSSISDWISTGSSVLDLAISNRKDGGLPVGRMVEFNGLEGSGKSLLSAHIIANTQKKGGVAVYIDTENAASPEFWKSLGVDLSKDKLLYLQAETVEKIFELIEKAIAKIRIVNPDLLLTIVVDSVAAASTLVEQASDHGKDGYATGKAIILSKAMRKITTMLGKQKVLIVFTNQLRVNLGAMPGQEKYTVSGGKALAYHCSVRVRLNKKGKIKTSDGNVIGVECKAVVVKNRMGPPDRVAEFNIYYDSGIADYSSWIDVLKKYGHLKNGGPKGSIYVADDKTEYTFTGKDFVKLMTDNPKLRDEMYNKIAESLIMKYKDPNSSVVENVEVTGDDDDQVVDLED